MVEAKVVSIKELTEDNPTLCLSPLRVFDKCHECPVFKRAQANNRIPKLKCKPHLKAKYQELLAQKRKVLDELNKIEKQIANL